MMREPKLTHYVGKHITFGVADAARNADGSLTVYCGYDNKGTNVLPRHDLDHILEVVTGSVIFLHRLPDALHCGYHMRDFEMILIGDTQINWNIFGSEFSWNSQQIQDAFFE